MICSDNRRRAFRITERNKTEQSKTLYLPKERNRVPMILFDRRPDTIAGCFWFDPRRSAVFTAYGSEKVGFIAVRSAAEIISSSASKKRKSLAVNRWYWLLFCLRYHLSKHWICATNPLVAGKPPRQGEAKIYGKENNMRKSFMEHVRLDQDEENELLRL